MNAAWPMAIPPRTPVVVGVGELTHRGEDIVDPIDLAAEAARRALQDARATIGHRIDTVATPGILLLPRDNPASRIAESAGLTPRHRISCPVGGNTPQYLVERLGNRIWTGACDAALIVGAESGASARRITASDARPGPRPIAVRDESLGDTRPGLSEAEMQAGLHWPHEVYPIFDSSSRRWRHGLAVHSTSNAAGWGT